MEARRGGFSMIELLIVLMVGAILLGLVMPAFGSVQRRRAVQNARDSFVWLSMRAQSTSVERGLPVTLTLDPTAGSAVAVTSEGEGVDSITFNGEHGAIVTTSTGSAVQICYTPRGFATCPATTMYATFRLGSDSARVRIRPLGQVEAQ